MNDYDECLNLKMASVVNDAITQMSNCWGEIYEMNDERRRNLNDRLVELTEIFFKDIINSHLEKIADMREKIKKMKEERVSLEKDLHVNIMMDENFLNSKPLTKQKEYLARLLKEYIEIKERRIEEHKDLQGKLFQLCERLDHTLPDPLISVPNEDDIAEIRTTLINLNSEKELRTDTVKKVRHTMIKVLSDLEIIDHSKDGYDNITSLLLVDEEEKWILTPEWITLIKDKCLALQIKLDEAKTEKVHLMSKLNLLWHRIEENPQHQDYFINNNKLYGKPTFGRIDQEIERCIVIKKKMLMPLITKLRKEIHQYWVKLAFSSEQTAEVKFYHLDLFTEESLDECENYLLELERYYEKHKDLYDLTNERFKVWASWVDLETRALDKNRLNNRGGQLLKEEKERKILERKIPKIENEIKLKIEHYMKEEGKPFTWLGQDVAELIKDDYLELETKKEELKTIRKEEQQRGGALSTKRKTPIKIKVNKHPPKKKCLMSLHEPQRILNQTITLSTGGRSHEYLSPLTMVGPSTVLSPYTPARLAIPLEDRGTNGTGGIPSTPGPILQKEERATPSHPATPSTYVISPGKFRQRNTPTKSYTPSKQLPRSPRPHFFVPNR